MASSKPVIHGRDHLPGGPDPIPGVATGTSAVTLYSSTAIGGDATYNLTAFTGLGGTIGSIVFQHASEPTDTSWYELHYGSVVTSPPYDSIKVLEGGLYGIFAYLEAADYGFDAWFGAGIVTSTTNVSAFTPRFLNDVHEVHATNSGSPTMAHDGSDRCFTMNGLLFVEPGRVGEAEVQLWHQDNRVVTIYPEQFLTVVKYW